MLIAIFFFFRCMKLLSKVQSECCDVNVPLDNIFEVIRALYLIDYLACSTWFMHSR
jgi:hypothetical protein